MRGNLWRWTRVSSLVSRWVCRSILTARILESKNVSCTSNCCFRKVAVRSRIKFGQCDGSRSGLAKLIFVVQDQLSTESAFARQPNTKTLTLFRDCGFEHTYPVVQAPHLPPISITMSTLSSTLGPVPTSLLRAILRPSLSASTPPLVQIQLRTASKVTLLDKLHRKQRKAVRQERLDSITRAAAMPSPGSTTSTPSSTNTASLPEESSLPPQQRPRTRNRHPPSGPQAFPNHLPTP